MLRTEVAHGTPPRRLPSGETVEQVSPAACRLILKGGKEQSEPKHYLNFTSECRSLECVESLRRQQSECFEWKNNTLF